MRADRINPILRRTDRLILAGVQVLATKGKASRKSSTVSSDSGPGVTDGRELRSRRTREKIRQVADALFTEKGVKGTTVDDIVAAAKIAKGTFYLHFSCKEELILQYAERRLALAAKLLPDMLLVPSTQEAFRKLISIVLKGRDWKPDLVKAILLELEASRDRLHTRDLRQLLLPLIEIGVARGELRTDVPAPALAGFLADAIYSALRNWGMERSGEDLDQELDHAFVLAFEAIRKR